MSLLDQIKLRAKKTAQVTTQSHNTLGSDTKVELSFDRNLTCSYI